MTGFAQRPAMTGQRSVPGETTGRKENKLFRVAPTHGGSATTVGKMD
eukprot:CAMPEP_0118848118 /NCGR_PEP_ID=MMETSP1162-20130426/93302_1 /TAXON_ID=33656 /ORGANISM="Phaeocystis Sp, Strain CCMP2710" /LENGTH=46 /DNA_ID= /DNA_START= /DNA_END= /DNA_ORIENTATION=